MEYIQTYFECFKDAGISPLFQVFRMQGKERIGVAEFDHCTHDGVSALVEMSRQFPESGFLALKLYLKPKPSVFKQLWELTKWYVRFYPFMPSKWKVKRERQSEMTSGVVEIEAWNFPHVISLNTRLLSALDKTSQDHLVKSKAARVWMSPVGLYKEITRDLPAKNRVSFIDLKIKDEKDLTGIQLQIKKRLQDLNYWGTILTMYFSVVFGKKPFTFFAPYMHLTFRRTGTFSNMGEWTIPGLAKNEWWVFGKGVVAKMSPVEGTAMIVNGRLGLSIHLHASLGFSQEEAQSFVETWKVNYLEIK